MESAPVLIPPPRPARAGFTIIEMLVVLAIVAIITALTLTGQSTFNRTLILTDTAYTVAFSARQAQSFGLSSRAFGTVRNTGYGLRFERATPGSYILFADTTNALAPPSNCPLGTAGTPERKPGNCRFDAGSDGIVETFRFTRGFAITDFCGRNGGARLCASDVNPLTALDVVFTRPNTAATMTGSLGGSTMEFSCVELVVSDATRTATRVVRLSQLGEISVNQTCP